MIKITGLSLALQNVQEELEKQTRRATLAMENVAEDIVGKIKEEITAEKMVYTSALLGSITQETEKKKDRVVATVFSNELHAYYLEFGRKGGKPPSLQTLLGWAVGKEIMEALQANTDLDGMKKEIQTAFSILKHSKKGGNKTGRKEPLDPVIKDLIILISIQRSIRKNGTKGRYLFTRVFEKEKKTFEKNFLSYFNL